MDVSMRVCKNVCMHVCRHGLHVCMYNIVYEYAFRTALTSLKKQWTYGNLTDPSNMLWKWKCTLNRINCHNSLVYTMIERKTESTANESSSFAEERNLHYTKHSHTFLYRLSKLINKLINIFIWFLVVIYFAFYKKVNII